MRSSSIWKNIVNVLAPNLSSSFLWNSILVSRIVSYWRKYQLSLNQWGSIYLGLSLKNPQKQVTYHCSQMPHCSHCLMQLSPILLIPIQCSHCQKMMKYRIIQLTWIKYLDLLQNKKPYAQRVSSKYTSLKMSWCHHNSSKSSLPFRHLPYLVHLIIYP